MLPEMKDIERIPGKSENDDMMIRFLEQYVNYT